MKPPRDLADEWFDRPARPQPEPKGMTGEQLLGLQKEIETTRERGNRGENVGERLAELRKRHYRETGAAGG